MTKILKVTSEEVKAAKLERRALEAAGLRPDSYVRQLSNADGLFSEEFDEDRLPFVMMQAPYQVPSRAPSGRQTATTVMRDAATGMVTVTNWDAWIGRALAEFLASGDQRADAVIQMHGAILKKAADEGLPPSEVEAMDRRLQEILDEATRKDVGRLSDR